MNAVNQSRIYRLAAYYLSSVGAFYVILLLVFAFNLGSHTFAFWPGDSWWLRSAYWFVYLLLDLGFILGLYTLLERLPFKVSKMCLFAIAILISWLPFGLAISMVDLATSRPLTSYAVRELHNTGFMPSLLSAMAVDVFPRHLVFSLLVYLLYFHVQIRPLGTDSTSLEATVAENQNADEELSFDAGFMGKISAANKARLVLLQAQEHYLKVVTEKGQELILYKFGQALRELPKSYGIQVHRSFWVARDKIEGWSVTEGACRLLLVTGERVPVSRRFEHFVKQQYAEVSQ